MSNVGKIRVAIVACATIALVSGLYILSVISFAPDANANSRTKFMRGKQIYTSYCAMCHGANGEGSDTIPPIANSDYLIADKERAIKALIFGMSGPIVVNGRTYNGVMPPIAFSNADMAEILSYINTSMGNQGEVVTREEVAQIRQKHRLEIRQRIQ